ncbi:MAG: HAD-IIA family hydrolase, partial [Candidatus Hadarchaeum sp.]|uniref:HAD-IIA family hydrolase n=1 Tax=Candidatus Hadarchaeum sp. TaxID=2883567 RepID=UPI003179342B
MSIRGYFLDLDGTVYRGDKLLPGAKEAIEVLRSRGRKILFLSNKPLDSRKQYAQKLSRLGIFVEDKDIINSSLVLARYLAEESPGARVFAIGEPPLLDELQRAGLQLTENPRQIEYVVAGFDRTFNYRKLNIAFQALRRGARFYATNPDRTCPVEDGEIPDAGAVIAALEATSGRKVEKIFGKPSQYMVEVALEVLGLPAEACAMVGDRLE